MGRNVIQQGDGQGGIQGGIDDRSRLDKNPPQSNNQNINQQVEDKKKETIEGVLTEMCFQLGQSGVRKFRKMFAAIGKKDFPEAGKQMRDSLWHKQTPARCIELSHIIQNL